MSAMPLIQNHNLSILPLATTRQSTKSLSPHIKNRNLSFRPALASQSAPSMILGVQHSEFLPPLYPKDGLGPTIETPSKPEEHRFTIDSLDPPLPPTTTRPSAPSQPLPNLPQTLKSLQAVDLTDPFRAAHMSATVHNILTDRLWRTVQFANYFYSPPRRRPAIIVNLPPASSQSMSPRQQRLAQLAKRPPPPPHFQAAVEKGVSSFLSRTKQNDHVEMNKFTRANRDMACYLQISLALERVVTKRELFDWFEASYGMGGEVGVDWRVDMIGLGVVFDGGDDWRSVVF
ncbi:hypothetical protein MBLNU13_g06296t1 [Cladosporium sp. NU13]